MNNLSSYCRLTGARMRASEKDLPVQFDIHFISKQTLTVKPLWWYFERLTKTLTKQKDSRQL